MSKRLVTCFLSILVALILFPASALATDRYEILKLGDQDEYVEQLQERLLELGYMTGKATGYFGTVTQRAVMDYQRDKGLTVDGKAGPETLSSLMGKGFSLPSDRFVTQSPSELGPGDRGDEVAKIQQRLKELEYYEYPSITGFYGPVTEQAIARFQRTNGLNKTGVADKKTCSLLFSQDAKYFCIYPGDKGDDVSALQKRLSELGYYTFGSITGYFGPVTEEALMEFQAQSGIAVDAKAGKNTRSLLFSSSAAPWDGKDRVAGKHSTEKSEESVNRMLDFAKQQLGKKYSYSSEGPTAFDCSGLVYYVLKYMGVSTARLSASGFSGVDSWIKISNKKALQPGDLLFFKSDGSERISHTGIYLSDGKFINASSSDGKVKISSLEGYYDRNFMLARRVSFN
ncbi:MAG: peptidoglycan-binding protein [Burkholderiales bacterium]